MRFLAALGLALTLAPGIALGDPGVGRDWADPARPYLRDRGPGNPTSMFGTYVEEGELLIYPFFEYYYDQDAEYSPDEFGYGLDKDFRARHRASEGLIFIGYGLPIGLSIELEVAVIKATQYKSSEDTTGMPEKLTESGLGDTQTEINWSWLRESKGRPEVFSYLEVVYPLQKDKVLIGTSDWEFKLGTGVIRGFSFGQVTIRTAVEYDRSEDKLEGGEYAVEYLRRVSPSWRVYLGVEGAQDEIELIPEAQWHLSDRMFVKLNSAVGLTSKTTDWAPEFGVMLKF
jgi:hypothetical protein